MTTAPEPYYADGPVTVWHGDCLDVMRRLPDNSVDAVVTDPPYGLEFMGKDWDSFKPAAAHAEARARRADEMDDENKRRYIASGVNTYAAGRPFQAWCEDWATEAYRLLKPGGHLLAFGGTRTFHRLAAGIEDAGFEIRDAIGYGRDERPAPQAWVYGSGFPKSLDVPKAIDRQLGAERPIIGRATDGGGNTPASLHKREGFASSREQAYDVTGHGTDEAAAWQGWGTALKPAWEPIVVARKPLAGTVASNVLTYGVGAVNIDGSRIGTDEDRSRPPRTPNAILGGGKGTNLTASESNPKGRWPANVVLDPGAADALDVQSGTTRSAAGSVTYSQQRSRRGAPASADDRVDKGRREVVADGFGDEGGASRYFKTVTADPPFRYAAKAGTAERPRVAADDPDEGDVAHPTVKPLDLMRYLVRLVTPPGGTVLEPFAGSGTTAEAAVLEGARCIAIEREADYLPLILRRIRKPHAVGLDLGDWDQAPTPAPTPIRPAGGRTAPRSGVPAPPVGLDFGDDWELLDA